jgi:hypothetical protein
MMRAYQRSSKYQLDSLWLDPIELEPTIYRTQGDPASHYTTKAAV